jgi:hypothetical protein
MSLGLTTSEVGQLLNEVCGEWPPAALTDTVHERTGGNPFFVQQTARLLGAQGAPLDHALVTRGAARSVTCSPAAWHACPVRWWTCSPSPPWRVSGSRSRPWRASPVCLPRTRCR